PAGRTRRRGGALLLLLLRDDWIPRAAHDHRDRDPRDPDREGPPWSLLSREPLGRGDDRALLALRRHRLDLPLPAPLPDGAPLMSVVHPRIYLRTFAALLVLTALTTGMAFVDLG